MRTWEFYYHNSGRTWRPDHESAEMRAAVNASYMAEAVAFASDMCCAFRWEDDDQPAEVQEEDGSFREYPAMVCILTDEDGNTLECLGGIIESDNLTERLNYRRVVEAELATQYMLECQRQDAEEAAYAEEAAARMTRRRALAERLRDWAQNQEMIDNYYTAHGNDCLDAALYLEDGE